MVELTIRRRQRRRRLFAVCQRIEDLQKAKTLTSVSTIGRWPLGILLTILAEARFPLTIESKTLASPRRFCADGLQRKINSFGITTIKAWVGSLKNWIETVMSFLPERSVSDLTSDALLKCACKKNTYASEGGKTGGESLFGNTLRLWSGIWEESYGSRNASIISTSLKQTTEPKISICAEIAAIVNLFIAHLRDLSPIFSREASFASTVTWVFTNYARHAVSGLFTGQDLVRFYDDSIVRVGHLPAMTGGDR